ncbi:hypothetical protein F5Y18DRAFT_373090 [Xylariaceae sp. FL1019]|nr:hypothetical protein F5Y18DRAFT_373090 [Xylariaceae sp. FL1019]
MAKGKGGLAATAKAVDPTLDALFASSSGPVKAPTKERYSALVALKEKTAAAQTEGATEENGSGPGENEDEDDEDGEEDDEELSELGSDEQMDDDDDAQESDESESETTVSAPQPKERKRKRKDEHDDLEGKYMRKLADEEERELRQEKRRKGEDGGTAENPVHETVAQAAEEDEEETEESLPVHESLQKTEEHVDIELDKANRTLFLGNVSAEAISSSKAKKTLISHLESCLSELDEATGPHKIESIRFRSTAFSTGSMPKRAAFITKSLMSTTTKSTNAYAVFTTPLASRTALKALNGTVVLERHMRVDSVAHPAAIAHRRCVFVGNLGFVDDETVVNTNAEGETTTKKRHKVPSDTEEGLWRIFGEHAGKVESVRVPRDEKTRVGKGFAYVQFYDVNDVESALLLNEKKFPPMLPRPLRVSRAKDPRKTSNAVERSAKSRNDGVEKPKSTKYKVKITPEQQSQAGRAGRLFGRAAAAKQRKGFKSGKEPRVRKEKGENSGIADGNGIKPPEQFIFEGRRASSKDGKPKDLKFGKTKGKKGAIRAKTKSRGARRAAEWRKTSSANA